MLNVAQNLLAQLHRGRGLVFRHHHVLLKEENRMLGIVLGHPTCSAV